MSAALALAGDNIEIPYVPEAIVIGAAAYTAYTYGPAWVKKMTAEIDRLYERTEGPQGFQYSLTATRDGFYPNVRGGTVYLNLGDVWKYGETTTNSRYSQNFYNTMGLQMNRQFFGNQMQIKIQEKIMIYSYFMMNGSLPPGNSIFR